MAQTSYLLKLLILLVLVAMQISRAIATTLGQKNITNDKQMGIENSTGTGPLLENSTGAGPLLGRMISDVVSKYLSGCSLVTLSSNIDVIFPLIRTLFDEGHPSVVIEMMSFFSIARGNRIALLKGLMSNHKHTCQGLILDVTTFSARSLLDMLGPSDIWLHPRAVVLFVGKSDEVESALSHHNLRNTLNTLYLSLHDSTFQHLTARRCLLPSCGSVVDWHQPVTTYWRCLYCNEGNPGIQTYGTWNLQHGLPKTAQLFHDQTEDFMGHTFNIVGLDFFPIMDYVADTTAPGTTITLVDCLDNRILTTVAAALNFTYIIREPYDGEWGLDDNGNWTGIVGAVQHEKADFSLLLGLVYSRAQVMDFSSIYINDAWVIISIKNQPLTQFLALVKPFAGMVWLATFASIIIIGVTLWILSQGWKWISKEAGMSLSSSLLFSWGAILSSPAGNPPATYTLRLLISVLWIFSVVISSAYKSSLIAHLTVRIFPPPINSFQDLVNSEGLTWGSEPLYGTEVLFFNSSLDPVVQEFYSGIQYGPMDEHMELVMQGKHAFFSSKTYMKHVIASEYTDTLGYTPLHFSQQKYPTSAGSVWGVRRGAPFNEAITRTRTRLTELGLFDFWMEDVVNTRAKETRKENERIKGKIDFRSSGEETRGEEVLSLNHLQGCFILLFIGHSTAFTVIFLEILLHLMNQQSPECME